ncbi:MAG: hypothetical protein KAS39_09020, partial [Actinomycetia bacterium]|nr:hypothetical protein [Actinomycetes bacterium]
MIRKKIISLFLIIMIIITAGCQSSENKNLSKRLSAFKEILPEDIKTEFDSKHYETVKVKLQERIINDLEFLKKYNGFKSDEDIDVFTVDQVIDYMKK